MKGNLVAVASPLVVAALLAGCGSSSKSSVATSRSRPAPAAQAPAAPPSGSTTSKASIASIATKHAKLGTILATGSKKLTVYLFESDKGSTSSCSGPCATVWPPVTGKPQASGGAVAADLGTITRSDGATQVTYKGHPLYLYAKDKDSGDAYGQGLQQFGAAWYVLKPSGSKLDKS